MTKSRLEAFSDGVLAIIITIMVLEIKMPHGSGLHDLIPLFPVLASYVLSFVLVGIYWGNHHHLLHTVRHVNSAIIWSNMHLLFWLSLVPINTGWMGENFLSQWPIVIYAVNLLMCGFAYSFLQQAVMKQHAKGTPLTEALKKQEKNGYASLGIYLIAIAVAFSTHWYPSFCCCG
ncbi:MAG: TMEM175 family protein [Flavobacteriales bacterium]|nr:TMEM175 family protein [Flavobacteriales bacterium]